MIIYKNFKSVKTALLVLLFAFSATQAAAWHVFFDLPKTLIEPNKVAFFKNIIGWSGISYTLGGNNPLELEKIVFDTLDSMGTQKVTPALLARSHEERVLPQIFCDTLTSTVPANSAIKQAKSQIKKLDKQGFYNSRRQRKLVTKIVEAIFNPQALATNTSIISGGYDLVRLCKAHHGSNNIGIIANWDSASFKILTEAEHTRQLMNHFDHHQVFISGSLQQLLPNPICFEQTLKQLNLEAKNCIFVSGIKRHVEAAQNYGMKTVYINNGDYKSAKQDLEALGAL